MVKDSAEVIKDFNEIVNMTADELKSWAGTEESKGAGWTGGNEGGETVGHDSAMKIIEILESNPEKKEDKYSDDQVDHMRKVVAYCKRHLAQESHMVDEKSEEELKKTKSYKSLKNWGHDPLKVKHGNSNGKGGAAKSGKKEEPEKDEAEAKTGDKRKTTESKSAKDDEPETKKPKADEKGDDEDEQEEEDDDAEDDGEDEDDDEDEEYNDDDDDEEEDQGDEEEDE